MVDGSPSGSSDKDVRRDLYPGYDVLGKRDTPSWNAQTRAVIDERLGLDPGRHTFLDDAEWATLCAICERIVPQPADRPGRVPVAAMLDDKLRQGHSSGYRHPDMPREGEAWKRALKAIEAESQTAWGRPFHQASAVEQDDLLRRMQEGDLDGSAWGGMPPKIFFKQRLLPDLARAYYAHPTAWNEIGWGGPAGPRGYVRLNLNRRDPWEAAEAKPGHEAEALQANRRVGR